MLIQILQAFIALGLPVAILSWLVLRQLYDKGKLNRTDDHKQVAANLKELKKRNRESKELGQNLIQTKWMQFGGGFYGLAALWTFVVIEVTDVFRLITDFPGFAALFEGGVISLLVSLLVNQIQNLVAAFVWFRFWAGDGSSIPIWFAIAYAGYLAGMYAARRF